MRLEDEMLRKKRWAVVGASTDPHKFGYKIYMKLKRFGYEVYPINPGYSDIEGDPCYGSLSALPVKPDVVDMVVNPRIGVNIINEASNLGIKYIWFQPGTFNDEIIQLAEDKNIQYVKNCVLTELDKMNK